MANDEMDNFYNPGRYIMILLLLFPFISLDLYFIINKNILFGQLVTIPFILVVLFTLFYWPFHTLQRARKTLFKDAEGMVKRCDRVHISAFGYHEEGKGGYCELALLFCEC
ncbi:hypothetical protein BC829DRAFT_30167 [Chytridium lagenaria]|nr:hypothetical protein BC829DRAFT_30167 [Chytridium lagenaria]